MTDLSSLQAWLAPILRVIETLDLRDAAAARARLAADFPADGDVVQTLRAQFRAGRDAGWLCDREAGGVRFSRVQKATDEVPLSVDAVHMSGPGPGHTHPSGEVDLCLAVEGTPTFDGNPPGWTVYPPGSWHVPTVAEGSMDILYFLPGGAIAFGPRPPATAS